jgi:hypothetical protein
MGEDYLLATHAALMEFAPGLKHHIEGILRQGEAIPGSGLPGKSIHPKFLVNLRASDAEAIARALKIVGDNEGYEKTFNGRQINVLLAAWTWHARRLEKETEE